MKELLKFVGIPAGILLVVVGVLYATVIDFWTIPTDDPALTASIAPNLEAGDTVAVAKTAVPEIPELVRCTDPDAPERFVIGRLVARNGEPVEVSGGTVHAGKRHAPSPRQCDPPAVEVTTKEGQKLLLDCWQEAYADQTFSVLRGAHEPFKGTVDNGKVFLVSDNRVVHLDSRDFGAVNGAECRRIYARLWGKDGILSPKFSWVW